MPLQLSRRVIAHHLVFSSYGFWLANDPRGSGSESVRQEKFEALGPLHPGRKKDQPTRAVLRAFYEEATPLLAHEPVWFDAPIRDAVAGSFEQVVGDQGYTVWACAVLSNHAHLCIRQHKHRDDAIWEHFAEGARRAVGEIARISVEHPLWANRPYSVYLYSPADIQRTIEYIENNPAKEGLPAQRYDWVREYDGWPEKRSAFRR